MYKRFSVLYFFFHFLDFPIFFFFKFCVFFHFYMCSVYIFILVRRVRVSNLTKNYLKWWIRRGKTVHFFHIIEYFMLINSNTTAYTCTLELIFLYNILALTFVLSPASNTYFNRIHNPHVHMFKDSKTEIFRFSPPLRLTRTHIHGRRCRLLYRCCCCWCCDCDCYTYRRRFI